MRTLGIAVGPHGGLVLLKNGAVAAKAVMPASKINGKMEYHESALARLVREFRPNFVMVEKMQAMPGQTIASSFSSGKGFGVVLGVVAALYPDAPVFWAPKKVWQAAMYRGLPKHVRSLTVCRMLWPRVDWRANENCKRAHDGICDAALIAEFCRRDL